ncbi:carboxypeptidase-like regulatory domain-containing protein [Williamwhitmania taraxaci]|uniref:Carboxypeptidase regulatory-like domain-containing protein n=1 Tax=Williamwhitmania taraxaci TaxID=1640674 RepID=A0A1G6RT59_9BACT|nr:carboxypeptidase-like regulatory domain-containing protein [Williamwhitmania taraxaci]SDD07135.1 Carboxypeptidase regulatory-like domain-containing protein [Williamwhitmania taraxaci]
MRNRLVAKQKRNITVKSYLNAHPEIVSRVPGLAAEVSNFNACVVDIDANIDQKMLSTSGKGIVKGTLRQTLETTTADTARKLKAYALNTNNVVLMEEANITETDLRRCSEVELCELSRIVNERIEANLTALDVYGITSATVANFQKSIDDYETAIPSLRLNSVGAKQINVGLVQLYDKADGILDKIDTLVDTTKLTDSDFYNGYYGARKVIETGTRSLAVSGRVVDSETGNGIAGVALTFTDAKGLVILVKLSAAGGGFSIKSILPGIYRVTAAKNGYTTHEISLAINHGERATLNVSLTRT